MAEQKYTAEQWKQLMDGCHAILRDPAETPARRRKARNLLDEITRSSNAGLGVTSGGQVYTGQNVDSEYEGF